jgi:putative NIF3 family GTP cyclohydrolase 1 type 2
VADALFKERMGYVQRRFNPLNHSQAVDAARLLEVPLMSIHTVWDNLGDHFMKEYIAKKEYHTAGELLDYLNDLPEFVEAIRGKNGPQLVAGSASSRAGKVMVNFTGGTNPPKAIYEAAAKAGIGTIVEMHVNEEDVQLMRKMHVNVIDTGHMAADSIGANIFLDELEKKGVEVIPSSGLIRVKRSKMPRGK